MKQALWPLRNVPFLIRRCQVFRRLTVNILLNCLTLDVMFIKGAPDVLLPRCSSVLLPSGDVVGMTPGYRDHLTVLHSRWATAGQRVLLLARRVISNSEVDVKEFDSPEAADYILREQTHDLVAVGIPVGQINQNRTGHNSHAHSR